MQQVSSSRDLSSLVQGTAWFSKTDIRAVRCRDHRVAEFCWEKEGEVKPQPQFLLTTLQVCLRSDVHKINAAHHMDELSLFLGRLHI